ncbi:MAG: zinc ABC transporter substrate-binding protein [Chloroflexi bacterium]|nr:zinc ABC transporter substrate-binding protein [Chloroflexota bacterium]
MTRSTAITLSCLALLALAVIAACDQQIQEPADGKLVVVTTTYPLTYLVQRVGGDRVSVVQLVKPGAEAHDFEPAPSDIRTVANADVFFYNHPAFEGWALAAASASGSGPANAVQTVILETEGEDHGGQEINDADFDPHVWLNPLDAQKQAGRIVAALVTADPDGSLAYVRNGDGLEAELRGLDELIASKLSDCALDTVIVSHLAYGHMAERYGFNQVGLAGLSPEFESGPSHIASVIDRIGELGIRYILQEPIVSNRLAETVAAETGTDILVLHPLAVRTVDEAKAGTDYISIMKANSETLKTALQCG